MHIDYHLEYDKHYYSVPHHLVKQAVEVQATETVVVIYSHGQRVASHPRSYLKGGHSTCPEHIPQSHRAFSEWSPERFLSWAEEIGEETRSVVNHLLQEKRHREQSYRRILALLGNTKKYGRERLNKACGRALLINSPTRSSVESILKQGLDLVPKNYQVPRYRKSCPLMLTKISAAKTTTIKQTKRKNHAQQPNLTNPA